MQQARRILEIMIKCATKLLKYITPNFFQGYIIYLYGTIHSNKIKSHGVSFAALHGQFIEIGRGTCIDSLSEVGSYAYIGKNCNITKSKIGRYVSVANNVTIGAGEHETGRISTSSLFYENPFEVLTQNNCIIESDAWIGVDAIILRGVRVGFGAVVGANAVVTQDVPDFAIVVGAPARIIRYRFSEAVKDKILRSRWWDVDFADASHIIVGLT